MQTANGHLTYCSNIHAGESWAEHFAKLQQHIPLIKEKISPLQPFGIGLRLSNLASLELRKAENMETFQQWLQSNDCYVFTMNGFPYGEFHHTKVKDQVHAPDWTTAQRVSYTIRLVQILSALLPEGVEGGISTSPLSYRFWHQSDELAAVFETATLNILQVVEQLVQIKKTTGKLIHIDIEPEPDGLLGESRDFLDWYMQYLLPLGIPYLQERFGYNEAMADAVIKEHVQLCYDVCHFAICYEEHAAVIAQIRSLGIKTGKIQISAALKATMPAEMQSRAPVTEAFGCFNEPVYLHQVVARQKDGQLKRYADMPDALSDADNPATTAWRAHFHVPLFIESYGVLQSTQQDIEQVLAIQQRDPFTSHLEIETYTWEVLPNEMRLPLSESIIREMQWVISLLKQS
ncbi:MAG: metabolite traffic protein EboE [Sediminibacterium sp.]